MVEKNRQTRVDFELKVAVENTRKVEKEISARVWVELESEREKVRWEM